MRTTRTYWAMSRATALASSWHLASTTQGITKEYDDGMVHGPDALGIRVHFIGILFVFGGGVRLHRRGCSARVRTIEFWSCTAPFFLLFLFYHHWPGLTAIFTSICCS